MSDYQVISRERHSTQRWQRYTNHAFAAADAVCPLTQAELSKAAMCLPIAFIEQDGGFFPAAVLGLQPGQNLLVAPDGRWLGNYVPAAVRSYPFRLAPTSDGQQVLCVDEGSGLVAPANNGEVFFNEAGEPGEVLLGILDFLKQVEASRLATMTACAALQKHQLIRPWPVSLKSESGEQQVGGLFKVDEAALNVLSAEALLELRDAGALALAYCQMLSMQHLPMLGSLLEARAKAAVQQQAAQQLAPRGELDLEFLNKGGTIDFGAFS